MRGAAYQTPIGESSKRNLVIHTGECHTTQRMNTTRQRYPFYKMLLVAWDTYTNYFSFYLTVTVVLLLPFNLANAYFFSPSEPGPFGIAILNLINTATDWPSLVSNINALTWVDLFSNNPTYWKGYAIAFVSFFVSVFHSIVIVVGTRKTLHPKDKVPEVGAMIIHSLPFFLPALTTMLLVSVLTLPLLVAFIVPGLIAAVYWTFAVPETVVLTRKKNLAALRTSYRLVRHHWWEVVGRALVIAAPILTFIYVLYGVTESFISNPLVAALVYTLSDIALVFLMVYFVFYFYDLFQGQDEEAQDALLALQEE